MCRLAVIAVLSCRCTLQQSLFAVQFHPEKSADAD